MKDWILKYDNYSPQEELLRESLCTLGNGYFATRAAAEGSVAGENHYPGTYLAGGYNRLETTIAGRVIENEDLVNWPDWTLLRFRLENGDWFNIDAVEILEFEQSLNLREAILERRMKFRDKEGRETQLSSRRVVSMSKMHLAAIEWELKPLNWEGSITIHSALNGKVSNAGVARYRDLNGQHLVPLDTGSFDEDGMYLKVRSSQSEIVMVQACKTGVSFELYEPSVERRSIIEKDYVAQELIFEARENKAITVEKLVAVYTSRDMAIADPLCEAKKLVTRIPGFGELLRFHKMAWEELWGQSDILLKADGNNDQLLLRLHIFHLFQTFSLKTIDEDVGIPARGWHGEAYRGHIFWDELFIFPFYNITIPELTRALLMYRYRRLPEARFAASSEGYKGAMFPWQSGSNGREETQIIHLNPESGNWLPDNTHLQRHVNSAIAYNVWQYFQVSGDLQFLAFYGAELLLDIAKFWASKVKYNEERGKYEIHEVVGPDEYHTSYPNSSEPGLRNNAYTNIMTVWTLKHALLAIQKLNDRRASDLLRLMEINEEELSRWQNICENMFIPFLEDGKIIEQFEGFDKLKELDWKRYHEKYGETMRLDRILEKEGDDVKNYKAVKQPDVLMLFFLFSSEELKELFDLMNYHFDPKEQIPANIDYYEAITSHGSTLSKVVYSWVYARSHREQSWHDFKKALISDFSDVQGGTTAEGVHMGAMAGTVDLIHRCYTGIEFKKEALYFNPGLPQNVEEISFRCRYRRHWLEVKLTQDVLFLKSHGGWQDLIKIVVNEEEFVMRKGEERSFTYRKKEAQ
ncbi:glycoside hydrolase family 65 protein [Salinimicrobium sediminilitoris]|uniref:glycoside hydrolase family 65 protein n=1 Tax=Salinimicrobium sediminilitoris TaxID=2876715 RepID=UPI001E535258|nr:glycosyl hydrolase family 65 protein [Salinimicrobium sediminilitoris]MCC8358995.1 glycoside hydrolase family 65 protein [Salinimicrobium sediminilitoris]